MLGYEESRDIERLVEGFISMLDDIGLTCEDPSDVGKEGDALLSSKDYARLEVILKEWSLNEKL